MGEAFAGTGKNFVCNLLRNNGYKKTCYFFSKKVWKRDRNSYIFAPANEGLRERGLLDG